MSFFFLKPLLAGIFLLVVVFGGWLGLTKGYYLLVNAKFADWHVKTIAVSGVSGLQNKEIVSIAEPYTGKAFSVKDAVALREAIMLRYPMLRDVSVKRGLLSGALSVSANHRTPIAKFVLPDESVRFIDSDSTVYPDPNPDLLKPIPFVELEGNVPDKLSPEFIDLVESALKLDKDLDFAFLRMNLKDNTVKMYMPDGCVIDFGEASNLKAKAVRAAQITAFARERYPHPHVLDFRLFESGKVFLTQTSH